MAYANTERICPTHTSTGDRRSHRFHCGTVEGHQRDGGITELLVEENRKRREAAKKPRILVKLKPDADSGSFIQLVLSNVGPGAALIVGFSLKGDEEDFSKRGVITRGTSAPINSISPGESEVYEFGVKHALFGDSPLKPFSVLIEYEDVDGEPGEERIALDVRQFKGLGWRGHSVSWRQMSALERIAKWRRPR